MPLTPMSMLHLAPYHRKGQNTMPNPPNIIFKASSCTRDPPPTQAIMSHLLERRFLELEKIGCCLMTRKLLEEGIGMKSSRRATFISLEGFSRESKVVIASKLSSGGIRLL